MPHDPNDDDVMREVRAAREAYGARFAYDIDALARDAAAKDEGCIVVRRAARRVREQTPASGPV